MNRGRAWWLGIFVFAAAVGLSSFWLPLPLGLDAPSTSFSAARAFEDIQAIAKTPHPAGSTENATVRGYLFRRMRELGLNPAEMNAAPNGIAIVNLYGELTGAEKGPPKILLMAHYDTTPRGPGAADDSTGVAVVLETVRALKARRTLRNTIGVLLTDGEEVHRLGANLFVNSQTNLMRSLQLIVNLEARGNRGPVLMFQTGRNDNGLIQLFGAAVPLPVASSFSEDIYRRMPNNTDLTDFLNAGKRGYNFAFTAGIEVYHAPGDTPEMLSQRTLQHYGVNVLALTARLSEADDAAIEKCFRAGDATFFSVCRGLLVRYPASVASVLTILVTAVFALAMIRLFSRRAIGFKNVLICFAVTLSNVFVAVVIGAALVFSLARIFKPRRFWPFMVGVPHNELFLLALIILVAMTTLVVGTKLLRKTNGQERTAGTLIVWNALMIAATLLLPGASYLFMWPTFFAAIALYFRDSRLSAIFTTAPAPLLLAPAILMLHQTITIGIAPVAAALVALAICLEPTQSALPARGQ